MKYDINIQPAGVGSQIKPEDKGKLHNPTTHKRNVSCWWVGVAFLMVGI